MPINLQNLVDFIASDLSARKAAGEKLLERSINEPLKRFLAQNHADVEIAEERHHPRFAQDDKRRVDFVILDGDRPTFAIEAKFLPEAGRNVAKYGHDFAKDLFRLGFLDNPRDGAYFLLVAPADFETERKRSRRSMDWVSFYETFLPVNESNVLPRQLIAWHKLLWHVQKNLSRLPLSDLRVEHVASSLNAHYCARLWRVTRTGAEDIYFRRIGRGRSAAFELSPDASETLCASAGCGTPLFRISAVELQRSLDELRPVLRSPSLPDGVRNGQLDRRKSYWICPRCDAYALGSEMQRGYTVTSRDGTEYTVKELLRLWDKPG